jgi:hypothetical protein
MRRFPPPWTIEALDGGFQIVDANGQALAYVYGRADLRDAQVAKALTLDEQGAFRRTSPSCQAYLLKGMSAYETIRAGRRRGKASSVSLTVSALVSAQSASITTNLANPLQLGSHPQVPDRHWSYRFRSVGLAKLI